MNLDEWIGLSKDERFKIRQSWRKTWPDWSHLLDEAIERFSAEFGSQPEVVRVDPSYQFAKDDDSLTNGLVSDPTICVTTALTAPEILEELPGRYAYFTVRQEPFGGTRNVYLRDWSVILKNLLGWSEDQLLRWAQEHHQDDLMGKNVWFDHNSPCSYVVELLIPDEMRIVLEGPERCLYHERLERAIIEQGENPVDLPCDWDAVRSRVNAVLKEIGASLPNV